MERYSVFLTPDRHDFEHTAGIISELRAQYGGEPFEPHLTLLSGDLTDLVGLKRVVSRAACESESISLHIRRVACDEAYFRAVYLEFNENSQLRMLRESILAGIGTGSTGLFVPHLSLLYSDMPLHRKQTAAGRVQPGRAEIRFEEIKIVSPRNQVEGWRDTRQWQTLFRVRLGTSQPAPAAQP